MTTQLSIQTNLSTFNFENSAIRVIAINDEPWFVAKDICSSLNISNVTDALIKLDDDEKMILDNTLGLTESISKQVQELNLVSESGMYTLILRCREAVKKGSVPHRFRKWVTADVLPQIRKTGLYSQNLPQKQPLEEQAKALSVIMDLYSFGTQAFEMAHQLERSPLRSSINHQIGGHYLHNLQYPLKNALDRAKAFIQADNERIMFVKGVLSLLEK